MKNNIAYKLVTKKSRYGTNMAAFLSEKKFKSKELRKWISEHKELWEKLKKFFPQYKQGRVIKSIKGSVGIMCFESFYDAKTYKDDCHKFSNCRIVEVKGIGKRKAVKEIIDLGYVSQPTTLENLVAKQKVMKDVTCSNIKFISYPKVIVMK